MATLKYTNTINIKPGSVCTENIKPLSASTINYAGAYVASGSKRFGDFKYGAKTYGSTTITSAGQVMPSTNTKEI